jgi:hypothetical protein
MDHKQILGDAIAILRDRETQYGNIHDVTGRACDIFELITGVHMSSHHANMFLHCVKLARIKGSPEKPDNYADGINYLAFAGEFATMQAPADDTINAGMRDLVEQLNTQEETNGV